MAQQLQLPDGRVLDYRMFGAEDGFPLLWFHGTPSAGTVLPELESACKSKGVKIIAMSRAGYGGSSRNRGRRVVDVVQDAQHLTEHLNAKRCAVAGWSGGGPHTLACAARLPGCVGALMIAGVAPFDAEGLDFLEGQGEDNLEEFAAALKGEIEIQEFCDDARGKLFGADVNDLVAAMSSLLPEVDKKALLENESVGHFLADTIHEALKHGTRGWSDDDLAFIAPWGFQLDEIKVPVLLYQGDQDKMVPFAHGQWLAKHLPPDVAKVHLLPGEGHISLMLGQVDSMLDKLMLYR